MPLCVVRVPTEGFLALRPLPWVATPPSHACLTVANSVVNRAGAGDLGEPLRAIGGSPGPRRQHHRSDITYYASAPRPAGNRAGGGVRVKGDPVRTWRPPLFPRAPRSCRAGVARSVLGPDGASGRLGSRVRGTAGEHHRSRPASGGRR